MLTGSPLRAHTGVAAMGRLVAAAVTLAVAGAAFAFVPAAAATDAPSTAEANAPSSADSTAQAGRRIFFKSPSGNIGCLLSRRQARCDVKKYDYSPPPKPENCDLDWGQSLRIRTRARFICVSDTVAIGDRVLAYGDSLRRGNKKCTSRRSGMVCRNLDTRHGFRLSRDDVDQFGRLLFFESPSGNIGCLLIRDHAHCDILKYNYSPPPKPKSCDFDWGHSLQVKKRARFGCVSDTVAIGDFVLAYGESLRRGNKRCTSRRTGMVCRNLDTGHGFRLSRDDVDRF